MQSALQIARSIHSASVTLTVYHAHDVGSVGFSGVHGKANVVTGEYIAHLFKQGIVR